MKHIIIAIAAVVGFASQGEDREVHVVALTLLGEARGEGYNGLYAVASTIAQRSINRNITPKQVCLEDKQFSCWDNTNKEVKDLKYLFEENKAITDMAMLLAANIKTLNRSLIGNADHYHNNKIDRPFWTYKINKKTGKFLRDKNGNKIPLQPTKIIGNHIFYKLK